MVFPIVVYSAKFIERKNWIVTGDGDGYIHVYSYDTMEEVGNFEAHEDHIMCLAVNATYSFLLSASSDHLIKLWDWNKGWECMRIFDGHYNRVTQVMFNPKNSINFASASLDRRVKVFLSLLNLNSS
jgi:coatomer subunit beta'